MSTKFVRFIAALMVIVSIAGNTEVARAAPSAPYHPVGIQFVQVATAANISAHTTIIDHPLTNGNPNAIILVTPIFGPGGSLGGVYDNHPIGVYYVGGKWTIFNQDGAAMPIGAAFNVIIPTAGPGVFALMATAGNISANTAIITNALTDGNPNAKILVTPNWNPSNICGCVNVLHPIGVYYVGGKWTIFNQDGAAMPLGAAFNVFVLPTSVGVFVQTATALIDNALTNGNPNAIVFVTPNYNPGGGSGTYDNHNISVWYNSIASKWAIFNQDGTAMPLNSKFNVLVLVPTSAIFVHTAIPINISLHTTGIDSYLVYLNPNTIVFTTQNYNPAGNGGMDDPHNLGVYYNGFVWAIFNQDHAAMPVNAAFNVLIPNPDTSVFVHKATVANTIGHITAIDYPLTNAHPNAILIVTQNWNPGGVGGQDDNHPLGVYYSAGQWTIFNQDFAAMPVGAAFNVFVPTARPDVAVFVQIASPSNILAHATFIDNPLTNGNPNAIVVVTPNWNPPGGSGIYDNHPIGVFYYSPIGRWGIFNQDHAAMPNGAAFNVYAVANFKLYLPLIKR